MSKYRVNWRELEDLDGAELRAKIDAIKDYVNAVSYMDKAVILGILKIEEIPEDMSLLTDNTGGYAE